MEAVVFYYHGKQRPREIHREASPAGIEFAPELCQRARNWLEELLEDHNCVGVAGHRAPSLKLPLHLNDRFLIVGPDGLRGERRVFYYQVEKGFHFEPTLIQPVQF